MTELVLVIVVVIALITLAITGTVAERKRVGALSRRAAELGWRPFETAPRPVSAFARGHRTRWALRAEVGGREVWLVWHQWTERIGQGERTRRRTRHLVRYFLHLGPVYPDVQVVRRTSVGAFFRPVRGIGTGDPEFDRHFLVKPSGHPAPLAVVNPMIRRAMLEGRLGEWAIEDGVLTISYDDRPSEEHLQYRAEQITRLAALLS